MTTTELGAGINWVGLQDEQPLQDDEEVLLLF